MSEPAQLPTDDPRGTQKTYIDGYGWVLVLGRRAEDERRADLAGDIFATYEENADRLRRTGLPGTVSVHGDYGPASADPKLHGSIRLVDSRRKKA